MATILEPVTLPGPVIKKRPRSADDLAPTFHVICWNDPVNLMVYVTHVFMKIFGWNRQKAAKHMKEVHEKGKSVLIREGAEKAEFYVHRCNITNCTPRWSRRNETGQTVGGKPAICLE